MKNEEVIEELAKAAFEANSGPYEFCSDSGKNALRHEVRAILRRLADLGMSEEAHAAFFDHLERQTETGFIMDGDAALTASLRALADE